VVSEVPVLRTIFPMDPILGIIQIVLRASVTRKIVPPVLHYDTVDEVQRRMIHLVAERWGDPQRNPLHVQVFSVPGGPTSLVWIVHHSLTDAWSNALVRRRIEEIYYDPTSVGSISTPFTTVSNYLSGANKTSQQFWKTYMTGAEPLRLSVPPQARAMADTTYAEFRSMTTNNVSAVAQSLNLPPSTLFLFALAVALRITADCDDVSFGLLMSGRSLPISAIENIVGPCINTVLCRIEFHGPMITSAALLQFQRDFDQIHEHSSLGLIEIGSCASVNVSSISAVIGEYRNLPIADAASSSDPLVLDFDAAEIESNDRATAPLYVSGSPGTDGQLVVTGMTNGTLLAPYDTKYLIKNICNIVDWICATKARETLDDMDIVDPEQLRQIMRWSRSSGPVPSVPAPQCKFLIVVTVIRG
jgi:hypothetical protein